MGSTQSRAIRANYLRGNGAINNKPEKERMGTITGIFALTIMPEFGFDGYLVSSYDASEQLLISASLVTFWRPTMCYRRTAWLARCSSANWAWTGEPVPGVLPSDHACPDASSADRPSSLKVRGVIQRISSAPGSTWTSTG
jgi:hypothetical protein